MSRTVHDFLFKGLYGCPKGGVKGGDLEFSRCWCGIVVESTRAGWSDDFFRPKRGLRISGLTALNWRNLDVSRHRIQVPEGGNGCICSPLSKAKSKYEYFILTNFNILKSS
ncbi:hypothetical protein GEV33_003910 [Tenebrio molitor]|uniref:Uncharacterized protein n=1 Tax=Tenebrio molitor TaxID=7067 RepID=A0A8J6HP44_TENMO|nr:hypothetical protein GEV33_003910 [Tenebrio molitor]